MVWSILAVVGGLAVLVWSADRFVDGASGTARHFGLPPLLIGMLVVGFGTSAPELMVSGLAAWQGNPGLGLGNAFGSNITNIALILGVTAALSAIRVQSRIVRRELPILLAATALVLGLAYDGTFSSLDAGLMLLFFGLIMGWSVWEGLTYQSDVLASELVAEIPPEEPLSKSLLWLAIGLVLLIASSRLLVWGAVSIAQWAGVSDLVIGLTIVAIGTSLPELASSIAAVRKNEHDVALGNIIGSGLFNTLAVVGLAISIQPTALPDELLIRDLPVMAGLTVALFLMAFGLRGRQGHINRFEGVLLVLAYVAYTAWLIESSVMT